MTMATMTASWTDETLLVAVNPALPALVLIGFVNFHLHGDVFETWATPIIVYLIVPFLDLMIGADRSNPPEQAIADLERDRCYYRWIVYAYIPIQYVVTIYGAWLAMQPTTSWLAFTGLIFSVGMINGIGINTAHELGHKRENLERWLSRITLAPVAYGHFFVEHNRGHHRNVATPEDPGIRPHGQSFWAFLPSAR